MNEKIHVIPSRAQLDYVRSSIDALNYKIYCEQRKHSFICADFAAAYDALQHLREIITDFSINCLTTSEPEPTEPTEPTDEYDL